MNDTICGIPILFSTSCTTSTESSQDEETVQNKDTDPKLFY